jgi:hypothetical protein
LEIQKGGKQEMKKILAVMSAFMVMFFSLIGTGTVLAETVTSGDTYDAIEKSLAGEHYDYKEGSLELKDPKTITLDEPVAEDVTKVTVALADYNTVRDNIFYFTQKEVVFYAPEKGETLTLADVSKAEAVQQYKSQFDGVTGTQMHYGAILGLCALILIVPGFFAFFWTKQQHSVLKYKLKNNLFNNTGSQSFN